ncbi:MAG TPA: hypothetical protein VGK73_03055 [Polyangiaceae bacterium]
MQTADHKRLLKAQADEREAKAALADLKLKLERGEIVEEAKVRERELAIASFVKRWLLGLSRDWPPRLVGLNEKELRTVIERQVDDLLTRMARMSPQPEKEQEP